MDRSRRRLSFWLEPLSTPLLRSLDFLSVPAPNVFPSPSAPSRLERTRSNRRPLCLWNQPLSAPLLRSLNFCVFQLPTVFPHHLLHHALNKHGQILGLHRLLSVSLPCLRLRSLFLSLLGTEYHGRNQDAFPTSKACLPQPYTGLRFLSWRALPKGVQFEAHHPVFGWPRTRISFRCVKDSPTILDRSNSGVSTQAICTQRSLTNAHCAISNRRQPVRI